MEEHGRKAGERRFDSCRVHVSLSEEKKKELDEAADKFKRTVGSTKPVEK